MQPELVVILLFIILSKQPYDENIHDISSQLHIDVNIAEKSIEYSYKVKLIDKKTNVVKRIAFIDFLKNGLPYIFPAHIINFGLGIKAGISHEKVSSRLTMINKYAYEYKGGTFFGNRYNPLYSNIVKLAETHEDLFYMICMIDVLRGTFSTVKEKEFALKEIRTKFLECTKDYLI